MIRYEPGSPSKITRASHIVELELKTFTATEWEPIPGERLDERDVKAEVVLQRFWKGETERQLPVTITLPLVQHRYQDVIRFALPGAWSRHSLKAGASYFLLLNAASGENLTEPRCFFVETAEAARLDVEMADRSGCPANRLRVLLDEAAPELPRFGALFCEYVASRIPEMLFQYPDDFHAFFRLLENPLAPIHLRWIWLREIFAWLRAMDPAPSIFVARTVFGCVRLAVTASPDLRQAMACVYLPNLLGISGGLVPKTPRQIFAGLPTAAVKVEELLQADPNFPNRAALLKWIGQV